jgi:SAM-dependent methyltransferase
MMRRLLETALQLRYEGRRFHEAFIDLAEDLRPESLLDLGCGDGEWTLRLARRLEIPTQRVYGTEIAAPPAAASDASFKIFKADLESDTLPLEDQSIELVAANQVLEHLKEVFFCLAECERVLKTGGHLALGTPNLSGLINRAYLLIGRQPQCMEFPGPHVRGFTYRAFSAFLRSNPAFELVRTRGSSLYPFPPPLLESGAKLAPGWSAYCFYLLKKVEHRPRSAWLKWTEILDASNFKG